MEKQTDTRRLVLYALFAALIFLLGLTPLGYIMLPIAAITTVHIPVIVGGYILGPKGGSLLGFFFGLTSLIRCFTTPDATAAVVLGTATGFGPYNLLLIVAVVFLPRVLTGFLSARLYRLLSPKGRDVTAMGAAAFAGSLTNTVFYLGGLYVLANAQTAQMMGVTGGALLKTLLGIVALNGVLEAAAAVILCCAVGKAIKAVLAHK